MESRMTKRTSALVAALFAMLMALVIAPGMAFAADESGWTGTHGTDTDEGWAAAVADPASEAGQVAAFTVYTQYADDDPVAVKTYTRAELIALAKENTNTLGAIYGSGVFASDSYVTVKQLLANAGRKGTAFNDQDTMYLTEKVDENGVPERLSTKAGEFAVNNDILNTDKKFFKAYSTTDPKNTAGAIDAPISFALSWDGNTKNLNDSTASSVWNTLTPYYSGSMRMLGGFTETELEAGDIPAGNRSPDSVIGLIIYTPASDGFAVYSQNGADGAATAAKSYTRADLAKLVASSAKGFLYGSTSWSVGVTTSWVDVNTLLSDAGLKLEKGDTLVFAAPDGFKTTLSYESVLNEKYFYPAGSATTTDTTGPVEVGTVLALNWVTSEVSGTAASTVSSLAAGKLTNQYRLFTGVSEENYLAMKAMGNRFATDPKTLTVIKGTNDVANATVKVSDKKYTGKAQAFAPTVTAPNGTKLVAGTDYTVTGNTATKGGSYTMTITGTGSYTGTTTATYTVKPAANGVSPTSKSIKASKLTKASKSFAVKAKSGNATFTAAKDSKGKVSISKAGKVTVKKGTKAGTYKVKTKVTAKATANYSALSKKAVTITVKVTK